MDGAQRTTQEPTPTQWWPVLPWAVGGLVLVGRSWAHWHDSDLLDGISPFGVTFVVLAGALWWRGPATTRARTAAALVASAGALLWFADVHVDRLDPGQPHRGLWFALSAACVVAMAGALAAAFACTRAEHELWQPSGPAGRR